ncbi:MAG: tetratricopeptide repeat protein [Nitrospira sp.]|nr:tetratricopeptide repeat protein [Nitrospira sp.]
MKNNSSALLIISIMLVSIASGEDTFEQIKAKADAGDAHYQAILGSIYRKGEMGVKKDYEKAIQYLAPAVKVRDGLAMAQLGAMCENGEKTVKDKSKAERLYAVAIPALKKMADAGDARSQYTLGYLYMDGSGGLQSNLVTAAEWFEKAAKQNYAGSQYALGLCYLQGMGVAVNKKKAVKWFEKAVEREHLDALLKLGYLYENGNGVRKDTQRAFGMYTRAAELGSPVAQFLLGLAYARGLIGEKDYEKALLWFTKALETGLSSELQVSAQEQISLLQVSIGSQYAMKKKEKQAAELLYKALNSGNTNAIAQVKEFLAIDGLREVTPNLKTYLAALEKGQPIVEAEPTDLDKKNTALIETPNNNEKK